LVSIYSQIEGGSLGLYQRVDESSVSTQPIPTKAVKIRGEFVKIERIKGERDEN
jgi:hypothetical protein